MDLSNQASYGQKSMIKKADRISDETCGSMTACYRTALYMRLSKDDDGAGESSSIGTQRKMLHSYAMEHGFGIYREYVDGRDKIGLN